MALPTPIKHDNRHAFLSRCLSDTGALKELGGQDAVLAYAVTAWKTHVRSITSKGGMIVKGGTNQYIVYEDDSSTELAPEKPKVVNPQWKPICSWLQQDDATAAFDGYVDTPEGKERKVLQVAGDQNEPIQDSGPNKPVSKNPAPPAAPFPAKVAPTSSQPPSADPAPSAPATPPMPTSDGPTSDPQIGPGTVDDSNPEYVGGSKVDPSPLPNPEGGALSPNPDNGTAIPTGGQNPDSFDDDSAKPDVKRLSWFMGSRGLTLAATADEAAVAKWPLDFAQIEKDFTRPNKPYNRAQDPQHVDTNDSEKVGDQEKPYQTGLPL